MIFNKEYNFWVSKDGVVCYEKNGILCPYSVKDSHGYKMIGFRYNGKYSCKKIHRIVWETFNGKIPENMQIDHINSIRSDNRLENLQLLSQPDNIRKACAGKPSWNTGKPSTDFGSKYQEHFGLKRNENKSLYSKEYQYYKRNGICRWELEV